MTLTTADRLEELSTTQRDRVMKLVAKERVKLDQNSLDHYLAKTINESMREYRNTLFELQKIRFDLGLDEFKGPTTGSHGAVMRAMSQTTTLPDGSSVQKQIFEAINTIEQIFDARNIPREVSDGRP
jgi:hypothetical protein